MIGKALIKKYKMYAIAIVSVILIGLLVLAGYKLVNYGKTICEHKYLQESEELRQKLNQMSIDSAAIVAQRDDIIRQERKESNEKLNKALNENEELRAWWNSSVPSDAVDYAYGLRQ